MTHLFAQLAKDEAGFIVSAELVLVATIAVLAMVVGLAEVALNVNQELEDVGASFGNVTQTYQYYGLQGHNAKWYGSSFYDVRDYCDEPGNIGINTTDIVGEAY